MKASFGQNWSIKTPIEKNLVTLFMIPRAARYHINKVKNYLLFSMILWKIWLVAQNLKIADSSKFIPKLFVWPLPREIRQNEEDRSVVAFIA